MYKTIFITFAAVLNNKSNRTLGNPAGNHIELEWIG